MTHTSAPMASHSNTRTRTTATHRPTESPTDPGRAAEHPRQPATIIKRTSGEPPP
jgi:hypothetical protein